MTSILFFLWLAWDDGGLLHTGSMRTERDF